MTFLQPKRKTPTPPTPTPPPATPSVDADSRTAAYTFGADDSRSALHSLINTSPSGLTRKPKTVKRSLIGGA